MTAVSGRLGSERRRWLGRRSTIAGIKWDGGCCIMLWYLVLWQVTPMHQTVSVSANLRHGSIPNSLGLVAP